MEQKWDILILLQATDIHEKISKLVIKNKIPLVQYG